jgi:hypothetical protein
LTAAIGAPRFRAPEAFHWKYTKSCDVWSFGILIGEICKLPGFSENDECTKIFGNVDETFTLEEQSLKDLIGPASLGQVKKNRFVALNLVKTRIGNDNGFLLDLAERCLHLSMPEKRPEFQELVHIFSKPDQAKFSPRFLEFVEFQKKSPIVRQFSARIKKIYKNMKITSFEWSSEEIKDPSAQLMSSAAIDFAYVDLELERQKENTTEKEKVNLDSFWNGQYQRLVAQGRAGAGKSTFLKWIAHQWSIGKLWREKFDVVIHVTLRELQNFKSLESIVISALGFDKKQDKPLVDALLSSNAQILWLLDGWDEVKVTGVLKLIQEDREPRVKWLIAGSRPEAAVKFNDRKLNVCGFSQKGEIF